jgi:hypothetical protein
MTADVRPGASPSSWRGLLLAWLGLCGLVGAVMLGVTTFLFAFSGQQERMVPVVQLGFWAVAALALATGVAALVLGRPLRVAVYTMLAAVAAGWALAFPIEWRVSSFLGPEESGYRGGAPEQQVLLARLGAAPLRFGLVEWIPAGGPRDDAQVAYALDGAPPDTLFRVRLRVYVDNPMCLGAADAEIDGGSIRTDGDGRAEGRPVAAPRIGAESAVGVIWDFTPDGAQDPAYRSNGCAVVPW